MIFFGAGQNWVLYHMTPIGLNELTFMTWWHTCASGNWVMNALDNDLPNHIKIYLFIIKTICNSISFNSSIKMYLLSFKINVPKVTDCRFVILLQEEISYYFCDIYQCYNVCVLLSKSTFSKSCRSNEPQFWSYVLLTSHFPGAVA